MLNIWCRFESGRLGEVFVVFVWDWRGFTVLQYTDCIVCSQMHTILTSHCTENCLGNAVCVDPLLAIRISIMYLQYSHFKILLVQNLPCICVSEVAKVYNCPHAPAPVITDPNLVIKHVACFPCYVQIEFCCKSFCNVFPVGSTKEMAYNFATQTWSAQPTCGSECLFTQCSFLI